MTTPTTIFGTSRPTRPIRAFTLIEILVVLGIIAILASISLVIAGKVTEGGRERLTADILRALDTVALSVSSSRGKIPATFIDVPGEQNVGREFALIDARGARVGSPYPTDPEPSLALFSLAVANTTSIEDALKGFDPKLVIKGDVFSPMHNEVVQQKVSPNSATLERAKGFTVLDAWKQPIRFVHPAFHGGYGNFYQQQADGTFAQQTRSELKRSLKIAGTQGGTQDYQFRRSARPFQNDAQGTGDADEGLCSGSQPYFYSAGPDKDAGTRDDNVYTNKPSFTTESKPRN